ncbi:DUF4350 domain-containing protein [Haloplanus salilacus]|uniref:DUF4350 domain-containing protein n=1 Tax=Haloplanus salilacus TaxID=2949994 RepID=UPI0030CDFC43
MSAPKSRLAVVFVVIVVVVVGGAAVAPYALGSGDGGDDPPAVENQQFHPDSALPDRTAEDGEVRMDSDASDKTVLVDVGHANGVSETDLEPLLSTLAENGHQIRFYRGERASLNESLRSADAFLVVSPRERFTGDELAGVQAFTDAGGRVLVMGDPPSVQATGGLLLGLGGLQETGPQTASLGSNYGIAYGSGYLYNMEENDNNFQSIYARPAGGSALTDGVDRVVMREAAPIRTGDATRVLVASRGTQLSTTRDTGQYAVVVRNGGVAAVGDTEFVTRENAHDADNEVLIGNLADFLVDGDKEPGAPAEPGSDRSTESGGDAPPEPPRTPRSTPAPA